MKSYKEVYDANLRGAANPSTLMLINENGMEDANTEDSYDDNPHGAPVIFGPPTNFKYVKMIPLPKFQDIIGLNKRPWLRIYQEKEEVERVKEVRIQQRTKLTEPQINASNREWTYSINHYVK